jgi:hypothetical protein
MPLGKLLAPFSHKAKRENRLKGETLHFPSSSLVKKRGFSPNSLGNTGPNKPDFDFTAKEDNENKDNSLLTSAAEIRDQRSEIRDQRSEIISVP